jgi:hypothetical protein
MAAGPDVGSLIFGPTHRIALVNRLTVHRVFQRLRHMALSLSHHCFVTSTFCLQNARQIWLLQFSLQVSISMSQRGLDYSSLPSP